MKASKYKRIKSKARGWKIKKEGVTRKNGKA